MAAEYNTCARAIAATFLALVAACRQPASEPRHPLDPLDAGEIAAARSVLMAGRQLTPDRRVISIDLEEPPKNSVLSGEYPPRRALAVLYDARGNLTTEVLIDLGHAAIARTTEIRGVEPALDAIDAEGADAIVRADSGWRRALARRGLTPSDVVVDAWSAGRFDVEDPGRGRFVRSLTYMKRSTPNEIARPVDGLAALVDLTNRRVAQLTDSASVPTPSGESEAAAFRALPPPITKSEPSPEWSSPMWRSAAPPIQGHAVAWRRWRFRVGMRPREGLVIYGVGFDDGTRVRSVLYRASLSEIVVPYGDPGAAWYFRNAFDVGELGIGSTAASLRPGADVPEGAAFSDAFVADNRGQPRRIPRAIAVFERDAGLAWKHGNNSRRARELVVLSVSRLGNYDYGFEWSFREDGSIAHRVLLTGIMAARGGAADHADTLATVVAAGVAAVHHQHFFTYRLDLDVDGATPNEVHVLETHPMARGPTNRFDGGFALSTRVIHNEDESMQEFDARANRRWVVVNPSHHSALGTASGYELVPGASATPFAGDSSSVRRRASFFAAPLWITSYADSERYAAGHYPNQSAGGTGLAKWSAQGRPLTGADVVLWYTIGVTHNPRPEDWPIMPVHEAGFSLKPVGFFDRNPAIESPVSR
jgi:primary-amine oxidase